MYKNKKGISPLIATVLIIGFTIVLAALVIQWGGDLFKGFQEETGKSAELSTKCSYLLTGVDVTKPANGIIFDNGKKNATLIVDNNNPNEIMITGVKLKAYVGGEAYTSEMITKEIKAGDARLVFGEIKDMPDGSEAEKVAVFAYINTESGEPAMCAKELGTLNV